MKTCYFLYSVHDQSFTETDLETEVESTDDRAFVEVVVHPTCCDVTASDYAGPTGTFRLQVSQPLSVALAIFRAALAAADSHADGKLSLVPVA